MTSERLSIFIGRMFDKLTFGLVLDGEEHGTESRSCWFSFSKPCSLSRYESRSFFTTLKITINRLYYIHARESHHIGICE